MGLSSAHNAGSAPPTEMVTVRGVHAGGVDPALRFHLRIGGAFGLLVNQVQDSVCGLTSRAQEIRRFDGV